MKKTGRVEYLEWCESVYGKGCWIPTPAEVHAGSRLNACRALGLPYPPPVHLSLRVNVAAAQFDRYDQENPQGSWRRWMPDGHDPGDEDRT